MSLTRRDVSFLFRIAADVVDRRPKSRWTGSTYPRSEVERLGGLVRFSERFHDGYDDIGVVRLTDEGWRRVAAEARRRIRK